MAEGILRNINSELDVFSAGTIPEKKVNPNAIAVMNEIGIDISGQYPKSVDEYLTDSFDFVITVCDNAREVCPVFTGRVGKRLHIGFPDPAAARGSAEDVHKVYQEVRDKIIEKFNELIFTHSIT